MHKFTSAPWELTEVSNERVEITAFGGAVTIAVIELGQQAYGENCIMGNAEQIANGKAIALLPEIVDGLEALIEVAENPLSTLAIHELESRLSNAKRLAELASTGGSEESI